MPDVEDTISLVENMEAVAPDSTIRWTWAGFVPFGLFCFYNGQPNWAAYGLVSSLLAYMVWFIPLTWVYAYRVGKPAGAWPCHARLEPLGDRQLRAGLPVGRHVYGDGDRELLMG